MAVPADMTTKDFSGRFYMNKKLSDDTDEVLALQGLSWFTRSAIALATITLDVTHTTIDGVEHIDISQTLTGGIKGTTEKRVLDWEERAHADHLFGNVVGQSRRVQLGDVEDAFLKAGWVTSGEDGLVESYAATKDNGWTALQIWGFEEIDGEKRYVRHLLFEVKKKNKRIDRKMVYDYVGPVP